MDVLRAGLRIASRRPGLTITLFVGESLARLVQLAWLAVLVAALLFGLHAAAAAGHGAGQASWLLLPQALGFLLRPRVLIGVGGAAVVCGVLAFGLSALLRAGMLASLLQALDPFAPRFSLRRFFGGGFAVLDRVALLALLEALAPWCGLAFVVPGLALAAPAAADLLAGGHVPWGVAVLLGLALAGGTLLALTLFGWAQLAAIEAVLRPAEPLSRALAESVHVLAASLPALLRYALALLATWVLALACYGVASVLLGDLGGHTPFSLVGAAVRTFLDLLFALGVPFLVVAGQMGLMLLYLRLRPEAQPEPLDAPGPVGAAAPAGVAPPAGAGPAGPDELLEAVDPQNVFYIGEFLDQPSAGTPPAARDEGGEPR